MNYKTLILPILSVLAMFSESVFNVKIPNDLINELALGLGNVIALGISIYGIFKNHKKAKSE